MSPFEIDKLVNRCDWIIETEDADALSCGPFSVLRVALDIPSTEKASAEHEVLLDEGSYVSTPACEIELLELLSPNTAYSSPSPEDVEWHLTLPIAPRAETRLDAEDAYLFHHYLNDVVPILTPVHNLENPWLRYPAIALQHSIMGQKHLLHSIMALAATFGGNTGGDSAENSRLGMELYQKAMAELRMSIDNGTVDYVGLLTTVLTFLFIEVSASWIIGHLFLKQSHKLFQGHSKNWKFHLLAAWKYLQQHRHTRSWRSSSDAWYVTQSFCLLRIEYETSAAQVIDDPEFQASINLGPDREDLYGMLSSNPLFGSTLGASSSIMACISEINHLSKTNPPQEPYLSTRPVPLCLIRMLSVSDEPGLHVSSDDCNKNVATSKHEALKKAQDAHLRAFKTATLIYYYQTCDNVLPRDMTPYVSEVLQCLSTFLACHPGNPTLWPAFIAGVEVCTARDKETVIGLFKITSRMGIMNRVKMLMLLESVWQIRAATAVLTGQAPDIIRVDWREVMRDMDIDILLI